VRLWEEKAEKVWKSWPTSVLLCGIGAAAAMWVRWTLPAPGISIAILGLVAAVMSLRGEMRPLEKASWMLIISTLLVAEIQSIRTDRTHADSQAKSDRVAQDRAFELVLKKEDAQLQETLRGFEAVGRLAKKSIENQTGGDSYAYVTPQMGVTPIPLSIYNYETNTLTGVLVEILPPTQGLESFVNAVLDPVEIQVGTLHPGTFGTTGPRILKGYYIDSRPIATTVAYQIRIYSQNFTVTQHLFFKPGIHHVLYKTLVQKQYVKSKVGNPIYYGYKTLFQNDWSKDD
jgi:hypothetical protein